MFRRRTLAFVSVLLLSAVVVVVLALLNLDSSPSKAADPTATPSAAPAAEQGAPVDRTEQPTSAAAAEQAAAPRDHRAAIEQLVENGFNGGDPAAVRAILSEDYVGHLPTNPSFGDVLSAQDYAEIVVLLRQALPDLEVILDQVVVEGDYAASRATLKGTFESEFYDAPPTHEPITLSIMVFHRFNSAGQIVEDWISYDTQALAQEMMP